MQQRELFERIFEDAHVVDIDLSVWDKRITLYVLADHVGWTANNQLPMFAVEFSRVRSWSVQFNHLDYDPPIELGPDEHVQWQIETYDVEQVEAGWEITLGTFFRSSSPKMTLICEDVDIWEVADDALHRLFPGWSKPFMGFIRPGLDVLLGYDYADRLQGREYADYRLRGARKRRR